MNPIAKGLLIAGAALVAAGVFWQFVGQHLPLGKLPGDIAYEKGPVRVYFPLMTSLLISLVLSLLMWLFRSRGG